ncbi:MAG: insulinase family protein [Treponema sp.]|nr:insulinase family protein [Treponema sp.]
MSFNRTNRFFKGVILCLAFVLLVSCGSTGNVGGKHLSPAEEFSKTQLSNGIPVVFKQNRGSKIVVLELVFEGGTSLISNDKSGIEALTLDLMLRGSEKYPYSAIQKLEYEKSFSLNSGSGKDFATAGFICIQRDLSLVLELFTDCMMNPAFSETDFNQKMTEAASSIASKKADPSGALGTAIRKSVFKGHPYESSASITEDSLANIKFSSVKEFYQNLLNAQRMKIAVVGSFSPELIKDFSAELEKSFGTIPKKAYSAPKIPKISIENKAVKIANEQAGDTGYIAGVFSCPSRTDDDYIPYALATMYLDDMLFSQVREKAGAAYSLGTGVLGGKEFAGVLEVFKATEKKNLKKLIYDTILSYDETVIDKKLDQFKNQYISSIFSSSQTAAGVASNVISSMEYWGNEKTFLSRADKVQAVSSKQVIAAYKKYLLPVAKENAAQWIIVDGKNNLAKYDF